MKADELLALVEKMTEGPWFVHDFNGILPKKKPSPANIYVSCTTPDHISVCGMMNALTADASEATANAEGIVALRNHAASIITALQAERDALRAALKDMHGGWQYIRYSYGDLCGVGWDRCDASARAALGEPSNG